MEATADLQRLMAKLELEEKMLIGARTILQQLENSGTKSTKSTNAQHRKMVASQISSGQQRVTALQHIIAAKELEPQRSSSSTPPVEVTGEYFVRTFEQLFDSLDAKQDHNVTFHKIQQLSDLLKECPVLRAQFSIQSICDKIRNFLFIGDNEAVSCAFRLSRVVITTRQDVSVLHQTTNIEWFMVRTLAGSRVEDPHEDRIQCLKLVRAYLDIHECVFELSRMVVAALVAAAEYPDSLSNFARELVVHVLVLNPRVAFAAGAFDVLIHTMLEGPVELAVPVAMACARILDSPDTRDLLRNGRDMKPLVTVFTDISLYASDSSAPPPAQLLKVSGTALLTVLGSWAGFFSLGVADLVACLVIPVESVQCALVDLIGHSLGITQDWDRLSRFRRHQVAVLLLEYLLAGLLERLVVLTSPGLSGPVERLIGYVGVIAGECLPIQIAKDLLQSPHLISNTFRVNHALCEASRGRAKLMASKLAMSMDDQTFKHTITATNVLLTKSFSRWNWDALLEIMSGPLYSSKRLDEALRASRFMKRVMSFYRPFKYRFSAVRKCQAHQKYVTAGKELFLALVATPEGQKFLAANKLLRQIAECLAQVDPTSGITSSEPLFSTQRLKNTIIAGYFEMLGVLTRSTAGQQILSQLRIFNMLSNICVTDRIDVLKPALENMDYTLQGHPRLILNKALVAGPKPLRLFATQLVSKLEQVAKPASEPHWALDLMISQIYDPDIEVCKAAVEALVCLCKSTKNLDRLLSAKPLLSHIGSIGSPLYMMFLTRPAGFSYLEKVDYVSRELDHWIHFQNDAYVCLIENFLEIEVTSSDTVGSPPRHFLAYLVLTPSGRKLIKDKGLVAELEAFVFENSLTREPQALQKLKAALWALGHIGSCSEGADLLCVDFVKVLTRIYHESKTYSVRGTALYVLGLICSSLEGAEMLINCDWLTATDGFGVSLGTTFPPRKQIKGPQTAEPEEISLGEDQSLHEEEFDFVKGEVRKTPSTEHLEFPKKQDPLAQRVLEDIAALCNRMLSNEATRRLMEARAISPPIFQSVDVFKSVMDILLRHHYKQQVRQFIFELFDTRHIFERTTKRRYRR